MDLSTGRKQARLIPGSRMERIILKEREEAAEKRVLDLATELANVAEESSVGEGEQEPRMSLQDVVLEGVSSPEEKTVERILRSLPEPEPEVEAALRKGVSREELDRIVKKVWERRQKELKEVFASVETEAQTMRRLIQRLLNDTVPTESKVWALEDLEFLVTTLHNAQDFAGMGGLVATVALLNDTDAALRTNAAWVVGTAVKYAPGNQEAALQLGAMPLLLRRAEELVAALHVEDIAEESNWQELQKVLYALGGLTRRSPPAQEQFGLWDGDGTLGRVVRLSVSAPSKAWPSARRVLLKTAELVGDIVEELEHRKEQWALEGADEEGEEGPRVVVVDPHGPTSSGDESGLPHAADEHAANPRILFSRELCRSLQQGIVALEQAGDGQSEEAVRLVRSLDAAMGLCKDAWLRAKTGRQQASRVLQTWLSRWSGEVESIGTAPTPDVGAGLDPVDAAMARFEEAASVAEAEKDVARVARLLRLK